jgi:hypothetical protein
MGKPSDEQWPTWSDHSGGTVNLPARMAVTGWHDDVNCGGEAEALDQPNLNGCTFKGARCRRVGRCMASTCLAPSDRRAPGEARRPIGGPLVNDFPTQN